MNKITEKELIEKVCEPSGCVRIMGFSCNLFKELSCNQIKALKNFGHEFDTKPEITEEIKNKIAEMLNTDFLDTCPLRGKGKVESCNIYAECDICRKASIDRYFHVKDQK